MTRNRAVMIIDDTYGYEESPRLYQNIAPALRSSRNGLKVVMEVKQIGNIADVGGWDNPQRGRIYSVNGLCPCLNTVSGGNLEPKIITEVANEPDKQGRQYTSDKDEG